MRNLLGVWRLGGDLRVKEKGGVTGIQGFRFGQLNQRTFLLGNGWGKEKLDEPYIPLPAFLFPLKPQATCLVGEGCESILSADMSGITCHYLDPEEVSPGEGGFTPCSRLLILGFWVGLVALIQLQFGSMCSSLGKQGWNIVQLWVLSFFPLHATHVGELYPIIAKPVSYESHPE